MRTLAQRSTSAGRGGFLTVPRSVCGFLEQAYGLDLRSLALFRIGLGALIIGDLIWRAQDLRAFYTDWGVLPRAVLLERFADRWFISLHLSSGMTVVQALLFLLAMGFGAMLLVGYRTKLAAIASWMLLISLQNRNPLILQSGDTLLRMLSFWAMFLPLNSHFSLDRALDNSNAAYPRRVLAIGSVALMAQVAFLYWFAALLQSGLAWWTDGSAMYYALSLEQLATSAGRFLLQFPDALRLLTRATMGLETLAPVLLLWPFMVGPVRTASIMMMLALQLGLLICLHLGHFPLVAAVAALGLIPTWVWSRAEERGAARGEKAATGYALTIYYDGSCEFCRKMVLVLKAFLLAGGTTVLSAQDDPQALAEMTREHSWVVVDQDGRHHFKTSAMAVLLRTSILWPLAWVLDRRPVRAAADRFYDWVARNRSPLARLMGPLRYRPLELRTHWLTNGLALFFLGYVFWWNLGTVSHRLSMPDRYRWIGVATRTDQIWDMFAPSPLRDDGWYVVPGVLHDGRQVDLFRDGAPVSFTKPSSSAIAAQYKDERWRKYLMSLYLAVHSDDRVPYGRYLCRKWNEGRAAEDPERLERFEIYFMMRANVPWPQPPKPHQKYLLHSHQCR